MKPDRSNTWLSDSGRQADFYISSADAIIVERNRTTQILSDLAFYHFGEADLTVLDLGCGDGSITKALATRYPRNDYWLLDGSEKMLGIARESLKNFSCHFIEMAFEDYVKIQDEAQKYNFIFSSNAIHHLDLQGKAAIFAKVYRELTPGGLFLNVDVVLPRSGRSEEWQFKMWVDWINETLERNGFQDEKGNFDTLPSRYKRAPENKPSKLYDQLSLLESIGFRDVDCLYKYGIFTIFGGTK